MRVSSQKLASFATFFKKKEKYINIQLSDKLVIFSTITISSIRGTSRRYHTKWRR